MNRFIPHRSTPRAQVLRTPPTLALMVLLAWLPACSGESGADAGGGGGGNNDIGSVGDSAGGGEDAGGSGDSGGSGDGAGGADAGGAMPEAWRTCADDSDCALVELGCCDHCNAGTLVSVHKDHVADTDAYAETGCELVDCTAMACELKEAICKAGLCDYQGDGSWSVGCSGLDEAGCAANDACVPVKSNDPSLACNGQFDFGPQLYAGCMDAGMGCGAVETCAINEETGEHRMFGGCLAAGWQATTYEACCAAATPTCSAGSAAVEVGQLCIRGAPSPDAGVEQIDVGLPIEVQVRPKGCWSSSCTDQVAGWCAVTGAGAVRNVGAGFCLADTSSSSGGCTDDCGGGGQSTCALQVESKGTLTIQHGAMKLQVEVPSQLPPGGTCVGGGF